MTAALAIGAAFVAWALIHTILATKRVKSALRPRLSGRIFRLYRLAYVIFASITLVPVVLLMLLLPDRVLYDISAPWRYALVAIEVGGIYIVYRAVRDSYPKHFLGFDAFSGEREQASLRTDGLYRFVRHPMYLGGLIAMWASPIMTRNLIVLFVLMTLYFLVGSIHEERLLLDEYGDAYAEYRSGVPRIVPIYLKRRGR